MSDTQDPGTFQQTFSASMETFLGRLRSGAQSALQGGTLAGTLALASLLGLTDCGDAQLGGQGPGNDDNHSLTRQDWVQDQGVRNTDMVSYMEQFWNEYTNYNGRFGYLGVDVYIKVKVKPVAGADLGKKHVGVEYHLPDQSSNTVAGTYFATLADGTEEWHVPVSLRTSDPAAFVFQTWYQDGLGNTYYDDNNGAWFPIGYTGSNFIVQQDYSATSVSVGPSGISGHISVVVADLAYQKDIRIRYTTDNWATSHEILVGAAGQQNQLYYEQQWGEGQQRWGADLNLPGPVTQMKYAIMYRYGDSVSGAIIFEFWDNAYGQDYVVNAP